MGLFSKVKKTFSKKEKMLPEETKEIDIYDKGLEKTRDSFVKQINILGMKHTKIDETFFEELEEILIMADIGVNTVLDFMDRLKKRIKKENITDFNYLKEVIVDELFLIYVNEEILSTKLELNKEKTSVVLFIGVNGVGKTTSIAKIATKLKKEGKLKIKNFYLIKLN